MQRGCQPVNDSLRRIAPVRTVDILLTVALVCVIFGAGCGHIFGAVGSTNPGACSVPRMDEHFDGPLPPNAYEPQPPLEGCAQSGYDVIVVLGCPTNRDGTPSACQKRRISLALELRALGFAAPVLVSGGAAKTEHVEAEAMAGLLRESGVPEDQIVQEPRALHTDENIALASAAMRARGWVTALVVSDDAGLQRVLVVLVAIDVDVEVPNGDVPDAGADNANDVGVLVGGLDEFGAGPPAGQQDVTAIDGDAAERAGNATDVVGSLGQEDRSADGRQRADGGVDLVLIANAVAEKIGVRL